MNWNLLKGYFLVAVSGLVIFAAIVLMILNGGLDVPRWSLYGARSYPVNLGLLMAFCALGGVILYMCMRLMIHGMGSVRKGRLDAQKKFAGNRKIVDIIGDDDKTSSL